MCWQTRKTPIVDYQHEVDKGKLTTTANSDEHCIKHLALHQSNVEDWGGVHVYNYSGVRSCFISGIMVTEDACD